MPSKQGVSRPRCGRPLEEYSADFVLVSQRHLDASEWKLFRLYFLLGGDWRACCRQLGIDRGTFFHAVYRLEAQLGQVYRELQPYSLLPWEYFSGVRQVSIEQMLPARYKHRMDWLRIEQDASPAPLPPPAWTPTGSFYFAPRRPRKQAAKAA